MTDSGIRHRLEQGLRQALRARDRVAVSALRSALAALDNAGAVPMAPAPTTGASGSPHFAGATAGLGTGEADRRQLTEADAARIVQAEITERQAAARSYEPSHPGRATRLHHEAAILQSVIDGRNV